MPNPKKEHSDKKTHNMKVLLDDAQYALVQSAAKAAGMKMAAYMRHQAIYGKIEIHNHIVANFSSLERISAELSSMWKNVLPGSWCSIRQLQPFQQTLGKPRLTSGSIARYGGLVASLTFYVIVFLICAIHYRCSIYDCGHRLIKSAVTMLYSFFRIVIAYRRIPQLLKLLVRIFQGFPCSFPIKKGCRDLYDNVILQIHILLCSTFRAV